MQFGGRYLCYFCFLFVSITAILFFKKAVISVDSVSFTIDPLLAESVSSELKKIICAELKKNNNFNQQAAHLKETYAFTDTISYALRLPKQLHINITATRPWFLAGQLVLLHNGTLVTKTLFDPNILMQLQKVTIKQPKNIDKSLFQILAHYAENLNLHYELIIYSQLHIELQNKQFPEFIILCDAQNNLSESLLKNCFAIQSELQNQQPLKNSMSWVADIRFEGQIILYKREKKGES